MRFPSPFTEIMYSLEQKLFPDSKDNDNLIIDRLLFETLVLSPMPLVAYNRKEFLVSINLKISFLETYFFLTIYFNRQVVKK